VRYSGYSDGLGALPRMEKVKKIYFQVDISETPGSGSQTDRFFHLSDEPDSPIPALSRDREMVSNLDKYKPFFYLTFNINSFDRKPCNITV